MSDPNQPNLLNGTPPQLVNANYLPHPPMINQGMRTSPAMDPSKNELYKPPLMVNGQASPSNTRSPSLQQHSGQLTNQTNHLSSNENQLAQQGLGPPQQSQPASQQANKSNIPLSGAPGPRMFQNMNAALHQQSSMPGVSPSFQMNNNIQASVRPQTYPNNPLNSQQTSVYQQPSPHSINKHNVNAPVLPQAYLPGSFPAAMQRPLYPQATKPTTQSSTSQYPGLSSLPGAPPVSQMCKSPHAPSVGPPRSMPGPRTSEPSPYFKNPQQASTLPPSSFQSDPSPLHQGFPQGTQPSPLHLNKPTIGPQIPNLSQSFPPASAQPSAQGNRIPGVPQGYQPSAMHANQPSRNDAMSSYSQSNSEQGTPTYQNQITPNRNLIGPPPMSVPLGPRPPSGNRLPSAGAGYGMNSLTQNMDRLSVAQQGFNKLWGVENVDLLQCRNVLPPHRITPPPIRLHQEFLDSVNCSPEIFCCTLNKIPETNSLLQKSRLPLGILIHPFRDLSQLAVIQCSSIVRCRACRTYINPFVYFVDNKRWKCNLCFRVNELPDEFQYDPVSKTYGDPSRRPEIKSSTIEFIAPSEYMLRPPQPAIYLFVLDISRTGCDTGYLDTLCSVLLEELDNLPGDGRTQIGFILFDSYVHFFSIAENYNQAHEMIVTDIDDVFLPTPDSLLVNLNENRQLIKDLLHELPKKYSESYDTDSALGPALQAAYKLMMPTGGRITVFQSCIPNKGPGALSPREDPNQRSSKDVRHLGPQTDFYKRLSLDCSTQQISVDLFLVSSQYSDLATLGGISQFSGGCIHHFPLFRKASVESNEKLTRTLRRYLTRKIGFEAVMRVRCSRGLSIHTFHGNFFVRSTDLLSLPNVNPDAGFGMQVSVEDSLSELQCVCFQAAVLYTSAKGERRIRVHTLCLPVSSNLSDILTSADQQAIIGLLGKMAVDRSLKSSLADAREAFINVAIDILSAYKLVETSGGPNTILAPHNLALIPLYILALLKSTAFRTGQSTRLDDRVFAMSQMKTLPLRELIQSIHPDLYHITSLDDQTGVEFEDKVVAQPARLSLSSEHLDSRGAFLLDTPDVIYLLVGKNINPEFLLNIFDVKDIRQLNEDVIDLPELENDESEKLRHFINFLQSDKPWPAIIKVVTETKIWNQFLINDKAENALSYYELLHHVKAQMK